jgi:hemolysin activation/secretion protein
LDNTVALATGETRATLNLALNSPLQRGEQFTFTGNTSAGSHYVRGGVALPAGHDGWRVSAYGSYLDYGYDLNAVAYAGTARVAGGAATFPWRRWVTRNDTVQFSVERKQFNNQVGGVDLNDKHVDVFSVMLSGDRQDDWGGAGLWMYTAQLDAGRLDLSGNAADLAADQQVGAPNRQGAFQKLNLALTRMQRLSPQHSLNVAVSAQKALQNLDSAMKFQLSGPSGVRAYGVSEPSVDTGVLWRTDWRLKLSPTWTASVFHDQALGWRDVSPNTATQDPNRLHLAGSGLGLSYESPDALQFNLSVAWRHGGNPARSAQTGLDADGTKRDMRVFATLAKSF